MDTNVLLLHSVSDIDLRRRLELAMGWPVMNGKIPKPEQDYFQIRSKFIQSPFSREDNWMEVELPIVPPYKSYLLYFNGFSPLYWKKNLDINGWSMETYTSKYFSVWTSKVRNGTHIEGLGRYVTNWDFIKGTPHMEEVFLHMNGQGKYKSFAPSRAFYINLETFQATCGDPPSNSSSIHI